MLAAVPQATPISGEATANLSAEVRSGLEELGRPPHSLALVKVRGDGHCLFRVVGAALVLGAVRAGRAQVDALAGHLRSPLVHGACAEVAELVTSLLEEGTDVLAALNDECAALAARASSSQTAHPRVL